MYLEPFHLVEGEDIQSIGDEISQALFISGANILVGYNVRRLLFHMSSSRVETEQEQR